MTGLYIIPNWFFSYDIALNIIFAVITLAVSIYALKIYKLSFQRQSKLFGLSFLSISFSYILKSLFISILLLKLHYQKVISLLTFNIWTDLALYTHIFFFILGLVTLAYMTFSVKNFRVYSSIFLLSVFPFLLTNYKTHMFHILSALLLIYIFYHYFKNSLNNKSLWNIAVMAAFGLLFLSNIGFLLAINYNFYYVFGDLINLLAYILVLTNLLLVARK